MKTLLVLPLALALPAFAGTQAVSNQTVAPAPESCLTSWFVGGSVGYLTELDEPMYTLHLGVTNNCWSIAGWNTSLFLEVGYTESDDSFNPRDFDNPNFGVGGDKGNSLDIDELGAALQAQADDNSLTAVTGDDPSTSYDLDIIPITLNVKFERALTGNLNVYLGGGLGVARVNIDVDNGNSNDSFSDDEWVFAGQLFGGLSYNITPAFQVYGGARWLYIDDADLGGNGESRTLEIGSDCLLELGARYQF